TRTTSGPYSHSLHDALPILIQLGIEKQENIRRGVDLMAAKTKEYLEALKKIQTEAKEIEIYKENLDDAIEGTQDAMNDAEKAKKDRKSTRLNSSHDQISYAV